MKSSEIRQRFYTYFENKKHKIVPSAPMVVKDDPTLMFTNAGMNQFKDFFLGDREPSSPRIADSQKCLRVSGKHNDLEEVGRDSYHHTMFEMLGNWSFGDYFKEEAIAWAYELLVDVYGLDKERLYATVFGGDVDDGLEKDQEAYGFWQKYFPDERILFCSKKDNFWEMGDTGPCGPCSEIHIDLRSDEERKKVDGASLVNMDDPMVVEIWNLVFIQYNRSADGKLHELPAKHVDTGMGFERLCMALQGKTSNYDTDVFTPFIAHIENVSNIKYTGSYDASAKSDIAMRVISDHLRAVAFAIADGQLPSNTGAGYVIRRILRRAVRYYFTFLNIDTPMIYGMVDLLAESFKDVFPELYEQKDFVAKVIQEEEKSFLRTLEGGLKRIENLDIKDGKLDGATAFELYDTYGFPIDLTRLIGEDEGWTIDEEGFQAALAEQKERSRADAKRETGDWHTVTAEGEVEFVGYDEQDVDDAQILKYRTLTEKGKEVYQVVLSKTPFYAESGGQVGDTGILTIDGETIKVLDTVKENNLIIHIVDRLPKQLDAAVKASIDFDKRKLTENNHSATHLLHAALRTVLGNHVQQKGSLVKDSYLRFDFSHFQKMTDEEIKEVEKIVNRKIRENIHKVEARNVPIAQAQESGAMMLFGEKYGDEVRMITFDPSYSVELCGGCHVERTGQIGLFKITSESAIAAGVRRIEAVTADAAESYVNDQLSELEEIKMLLKNPQDLKKSIEDLMSENKNLAKEKEQLLSSQAGNMKTDLIKDAIQIKDLQIVKKVLSGLDNKTAKNLAYSIINESDVDVVLFGLEANGKPQLMLAIKEDKVKSNDLHAGNIVRELAKNIKGGGGGQPFFATAGGSDTNGLSEAINKLDDFLN